jgi:Tfp pilus assembly protein PilO
MTGSKIPSPEKAGIRQRAALRLAALKISRQRSAVGLAEIVGLLFAAIMLLAVAVAYFSFFVPAKLYSSSALNERDKLQKSIKAKQEALKTGTDKDSSMLKISNSLVDFEANFLESRSAGRVSLIEELNDFIRSNNLKNTAGPSFVALAQLGANGKPVATTATKSGNAKWQSFYPGIGVSVTLEGQYQNLRHFIRDVEANKHFVVINSVALEKATNAESPKLPSTTTIPGDVPAASKSTLVSLQMDMSTYFRREASDSSDASHPAGQ